MILGRIICLFKGHRRGVEFHRSSVYVHFRCPRCLHYETRYKVKPPAPNGTEPGDQAPTSIARAHDE